MEAMRQGQAEAVELLLNVGANPNMREKVSLFSTFIIKSSYYLLLILKL